MRKPRYLASACAVVMISVLGTASAAHAAGLRTGDLVAFVRGGNLFVASGTAAPVQVTTGGGYSWPRWAPATNLGAIAYVHNGDLFVSNYSSRFGLTGTIRVSTGAAPGGAGWSPDGHHLAYVDSNADKLRVADITVSPVASVTLADANIGSGHGTDFSPLINSASVAWSPNGRWIAFPNGECTGIFDNCLSYIDTTTLDQNDVAAFSGGGDEREGYATVPAWSADSKQLYWTQQSTDPLINNGNTVSKLQIWHLAIGQPNGLARQWGRDGDSEIAPFPSGGTRFLLTVPVGHTAWVAESEGGVRTLLYPGYQPSWVLN